MKLIENNWWLSKQVEYKGNLLIVPVWTNWISVDEDGNCCAFKDKPFSFHYCWESELFDEDSQFIVCKVGFEEGESWKESLEFVGEEQ